MLTTLMDICCELVMLEGYGNICVMACHQLGSEVWKEGMQE
jgi:hypothetical protein